MTKFHAAAAAALLAAVAGHAGEAKVKDKDAPTNFAVAAAGPVAPFPEAAPCAGGCDRCRHHDCRECLARVKGWLCFVPLRTCPCECEHPSSCRPPLYLYFVRECAEGPHPTDYHDCSTCATGKCSACGGGPGLFRRAHGCPTCDTCK